MSDPEQVNIDDLADAEDRAGVVDQQTAAEAGIEQSDATETSGESEAHPS